MCLFCSNLGGIDEGYFERKIYSGLGRDIRVMRDSTRKKMHMFLIKYTFQATVYMIWRERNRRRRGEVETPAALLIKLLDKNMRNKLTLVQKKGDREIREGMQYWFETR